MARKRRPGAVKCSPEWRERVAQGTRRALARRRVLPEHMRLLMRGIVAEPVRPLLRASVAEAAEFLDASGGDEAGPKVRAMCGIAATMSLLANVLLLGFVQKPDEETAVRIGSLLGSRARVLSALGLPAVRKELDLTAYLRDREAAGAAASGACEPISGEPMAQGDSVADRTAQGNGARLAVAEAQCSTGHESRKNTEAVASDG
jgi:hypothetical protein